MFISFCAIISIIVNDFDRNKLLYATFYPEKYIYIDTLLTEEVVNPSTSGSNKTYYIYKGFCKSDNSKNGIQISFGLVEDDEVYFNTKEIPVWRNSLCDILLFRDNNKKYPSPYSFSMRNSWLDFILPSLFLPCIMYLIYLNKIKK